MTLTRPLADINAALSRYHELRLIFRCVRNTFSLPRQHSLAHYPHNIREFGAPGGLCSSITESRHITAVKKPWRRSNRYNALSQMLRTNERLDKLVSLRTHFVQRKMLPPLHGPPPNPLDDENLEEGAVDEELSAEVKLARHRGESPAYMFYLRNVTDYIFFQNDPTHVTSMNFPSMCGSPTSKLSHDASYTTNFTLMVPYLQTMSASMNAQRSPVG